jgi:hypothetical protein
LSTSTPSQPFPVSVERAQLESLQAELSDRASTVHFARSAVTLVGALIMASASGKLFWDSKHFPFAGILAALVSLGLAAFSVHNYRRGKRHLAREMQIFDSVQSLRRTLGMDDPSVLLPQ